MMNEKFVEFPILMLIPISWSSKYLNVTPVIKFGQIEFNSCRFVNTCDPREHLSLQPLTLIHP